MFCPQCKAEYRRGFTRCSDCNVPLVSVLEKDPAPVEDVTTGTGSVEVFSAADTFEAETVKGLLETNGIEVFLSGGESVPGLPGAVSLFVNNEQAELADELIEDYRMNLPDDNKDVDRGDE
ncbi:MAG TPA: DUF2007 domain-containing protein [Terriglobia bacterium]|nr:DUF2007 domain-containing protein [Terriglobia bacterium]